MNGLPYRLQASLSRTNNCKNIIFMSLSNKESVVVNTVVPTHALENQTEIKTLSFYTRVTCLLSL